LSNPTYRSASLSERLRPKVAIILQPIARALLKLHITANILTFIGLLLAVGVGVAVMNGQMLLGGVLMLLSGPMDALDGAVARQSGNQNSFGAFFDSTCDRYAEGFVLLGLSIYGLAIDDQRLVLLAFVAFWGSLLISYTRARAEGLGIECKVGLFTRMERFILISAMLILNQILIGLIILAVLTHITAVQRIVHVWRASHAH
jgi:CDP-diacylglycerol---glycerol-3-phosphate 3-phosphatidyltransferase